MIFHNLKFIREHQRITCPDCSIRMEPFSCREVVVDRCGNCQGIWFDKKELGIFRDSLKELPIESIRIDKSLSSDVYTISSCPRCLRMLTEANYGYNSKVVLKKCASCEGIWLSQAELLKFIDMTRIAKIVEPEVKGVLREWTKFDKENRIQKNNNIKLGQLNQRHNLMCGGGRFGMILPLYDDNPRINKPWVTVIFIIFCIIFFILTISQKNYLNLGLIPGDLKLASFITSLFLHGSVMHLLGNIFYLWTFGDNVEDVIGPAKYVCYFFLCGILAGVTHVLLNSFSMIPAIGASGAISGLMGGYLYLFPNVNLKTLVGGRIVDIPIWIYLGFWFLLQLLSTIVAQGMTHVSIAFGAHVGGFVAGYVLIWVMVNMGIVDLKPL